MPNKRYAKEWLALARHSLEAAKILYDENHFTDIIGVDLQQAIEKSLKAILAFNNRQIPKTHNLIKILNLIKGRIEIKNDYYDLCEKASMYYKEDRYPNIYYTMPERDEIKKVLTMANDIYANVEMYINA